MKNLFTHFLVLTLGYVIAWFLYSPIDYQKIDSALAATKCLQQIQSTTSDEALSLLLANAQKKINTLENNNKELGNLSSSYKGQLASLLSQPSFRNRIAGMDKDQLESKLGTLFEKEDLDGITDIHQFSNRLLDMALQQESADFNNANVSINVSTSSSYMDGGSPYLSVEEHQKLYAHFMSSESLNKVFVKWQNKSTGEFLVFKRFPLKANDPSHHIWVIPRTGWKAGEYMVGLYAVDNNMTPLAAYPYTITDITSDTDYEEIVRPDIQSEGGGGKNRKPMIP